MPFAGHWQCTCLFAAVTIGSILRWNWREWLSSGLCGQCGQCGQDHRESVDLRRVSDNAVDTLKLYRYLYLARHFTRVLGSTL